MDRLAAAAPSSRELLTRLAQRSANLGNATVQLLKILDEFGSAHFEQAICEALSQNTPHPAAVRQILDRRRRAAGLGPVVPVELPDDPRVRDLTVRPHPLERYDALADGLLENQEREDHGQQATE